jgi:uncharacterized membrane protein
MIDRIRRQQEHLRRTYWVSWNTLYSLVLRLWSRVCGCTCVAVVLFRLSLLHVILFYFLARQNSKDIQILVAAASI